MVNGIVPGWRGHHHCHHCLLLGADGLVRLLLLQ